MKFYMPSSGADDWKRGLAEPEKQWRAGYSAYALAHAWEANRNFPQSVQASFEVSIFKGCEILLGLPEHKVPMPAKGADSQNDLFVLGKMTSGELLSMMVEGKVSEPFGQRLSDWHSGTVNKTERLQGILERIGLPHDIPNTIRYQLLHRTASAVLEAQRFNAKYALMLVHSFSQYDEHFDDFKAFTGLYGVIPLIGHIVKLTTVHNIELYTAWIRGDKRYLQAQEK